MRRFAAVLLAICALAVPASAQAFDVAVHDQELTRSVASNQLGFGQDATDVLAAVNKFPDYYHAAGVYSNPASGVGPQWLKELALVVEAEDWTPALIRDSTKMHFHAAGGYLKGEIQDSSLNSMGMAEQWERLQQNTYLTVKQACKRNETLRALTAFAISTHAVQDFYAHTNWIEKRPGDVGAIEFEDGPGWTERGFGDYPTWFDIPKNLREGAALVGDGGAKGIPGRPDIQPHGQWMDTTAKTAAKDSSSNHGYLKAAITAFYATTRWGQAVERWINDPACWTAMQNFTVEGKAQGELDRENTKLPILMREIGALRGDGMPLGSPEPGTEGPGGSVVGAYFAIREYTNGGKMNRSRYRALYEDVVHDLAAPLKKGATRALLPVAPSTPLQESTEVILVEVDRFDTYTLGDVVPGDKPDVYGRFMIDGDERWTSKINGRDSFNFPYPHRPWTLFKVVPKAPNRCEPVTSVLATVTTADVKNAGTDDDVRLRLGRNLSWELDKPGRDDFERNSTDTYSVPIDPEVWNGLCVGDITTSAIEKSGDDGLKLVGLTLTVNDLPVYDNQAIGKWLDGNEEGRRFRPTNFVRQNPVGTNVSVVFKLKEGDAGSKDDLGDVNGDAGRWFEGVNYVPEDGLVEGETKGGYSLGGVIHCGRGCTKRTDSGEAGLHYRISTIIPKVPALQPPAQQPTLKPEEGKPDLIITEFTPSSVMVKNIGDADAGQFRLHIENDGPDTPQTSVNLDFLGGLKAGDQVRRKLTLPCASGKGPSAYRAVVDDLDGVLESKEANNSLVSVPCIV